MDAPEMGQDEKPPPNGSGGDTAATPQRRIPPDGLLIHGEAAYLADRFFPSPPADLSDIDPEAQYQEGQFEVPRQADAKEVIQLLRNTGPWKSPSPCLFLACCLPG